MPNRAAYPLNHRCVYRKAYIQAYIRQRKPAFFFSLSAVYANFAAKMEECALMAGPSPLASSKNTKDT